MNRRSFFALLASLPVVGRLVPSAMVHMQRVTSIDKDGHPYVVKKPAVAIPDATKMTVDSDGHRTYERTFHALSEHPIGIPEHGSMYCHGNDIDYFAFAVPGKPKAIGGGLYEIVVTYSTRGANG